MVKPDEIGKTRIRSSYHARKENGAVEGSILDDVIIDDFFVEDKDCNIDVELKFSVDLDPTSFKEAFSHDEWIYAMKKGYYALIKNGTWKLVYPPYTTKPIGCKWVYKNKDKSNVSLDKHKARLVTKGYAQKEGINYDETFSPTSIWETIQYLIAMYTQHGWKTHHMDVKTVFLNGDLK